ncbi:lysylphosphatidylglycerol synthase transmembrane domain-containing protein [Sphingomonas sp. URHD0057]|uniref:lysylphosphatidylglycerol synthase transmembrane domain-containing protein n=1 Tax=Sphingomonas sp. URHD0057 TaxID=1380389 RepID=UPI000A6AEEFE|nr:lysylphosphatidylglycerol synthase transmembrane domain-containing protein [Sphingomonas sp. URHD0057]
MADRATQARNRRSTGADRQIGLAAHWRNWLLALLLTGALVFAVFHWGDVKKFAELIARAEPLWLLAALLLQLATYVALAWEWSLVLRAGGCPVPLRRLLRLTITKHFADQTVPTAGMSGNVVVADRLMALGTSRGTAVAAVILTIVAYYASYAVAAVVVLGLLFLHGNASGLVAGVMVAFFALAAAIPALAFWLQKKGEGALPGWLERFGALRELSEMMGEAPTTLVRDRRLIVKLTLLNGAQFALDAWTMQFCLFALGVKAPFAAAFAGFIMASIVTTLGPIPMGLGSFEAVSVGTLRAMGIPLEAAISATLLFRGFILWLPLIPGMITSRRDLKRTKDDSE